MVQLRFYLIAALLLYTTIAISQSDSLWTLVRPDISSLDKSQSSVYSNYKIFEINKVYAVGLQKTTRALTQGTSIDVELPLPDGTIETFRISQNQVLPKKLQLEYPEIKSFTGYGITKTHYKAYIDINPKGLSAMILAGSTVIYIDRDYNNRPYTYLSYYRKDAQSIHDQKWSCGHNYEASIKKNFDPTNNNTEPLIKKTRRHKSATTIKEYRIAIATTSEYTSFFGGTVTDGLAAVVTAINRVSGIYESEMGIRFSLIANNDQLIYADAANDPWNNSNSDLNLVQDEIDNMIGSSNYDIGHIFTTSSGGIAIDGVCDDDYKAKGLTGLSNPTGDAFYVDFVAHEIGHQFSGDHTYNGALDNCNSQHRTIAAYEPGSGSTIMAYAGICDDDNIQNSSDVLFHLKSLRQISDYTNNEADCFNNISTANNAPTVNADAFSIDGKVIPASTPFEIIGTGADQDGDQIMYEWSQWDLGPQQELSQGDNGASPIFRTWIPSTAPIRIFPRLSDLINNTTSAGETLPTTNRDLNFQLTARDQQGGWDHDSIKISVANGAGPFEITNLNSSTSISGNTMLTWDVAGTTANGINCGSVDIFLSTDGGFTYPVILSDNEANDGSTIITIPYIPTQTARIKIKCSDNIFFDINDANLSIESDCNVTSDINDNPIVDGTYSSVTELTSSGVIPTDGQVTFTGGSGVQLSPNFMINQAGMLSIFITDCN